MTSSPLHFYTLNTKQMVTITDGSIFLTQEAKCCISHQLKSGTSHLELLVYPVLNWWKGVEEFGLTVRYSHGHPGNTTAAAASSCSCVHSDPLASLLSL